MNESAADRLQTSVDELNTRLDGIAKSLGRLRRVAWIAIGAGILAVATLGLTVADNHAGVESLKQQFCEPIVQIVPAPGEALPPPGPDGDRGRSVIGSFRRLAGRWDCTLRH